MRGRIIRVRNAIIGVSMRTRRSRPRDSREFDQGYFLAGSTAIASACVYVAST